MTDLDVWDLDEHADRYTAQVLPELHPNQPQPRIDQWPAEDRQAFGLDRAPRDYRSTADAATEAAERWARINGT